MKPKSVLIVAALCVLVAALFIVRPSIAQNDGASAPGKGGDEEDLPVGRYAMAASAGDLFLCDTTNGECWRMKVVRKTDDGILMNWKWESAAPAVVNSR